MVVKFRSTFAAARFQRKAWRVLVRKVGRPWELQEAVIHLEKISILRCWKVTQRNLGTVCFLDNVDNHMVDNYFIAYSTSLVKI